MSLWDDNDQAMPWKVDEVRQILSTIPFNVEELFLSGLKGKPHPYYRLTCRDWVNILPVTSDGNAILIRQPRAGTMRQSLEIPGGMIDANERDATMAGLRELEEETGYTSRRVLPLAVMCPNPAIQSNRLHCFLALDCYINERREFFPDPSEDIAVVPTPVGELDGLVRHGQIGSALAGFTIMLAAKYLQTFAVSSR